MRTKRTASRSTVRQTLYPVIRVRRRRSLNRAEPGHARAPYQPSQYTRSPAESR